MSKQYTYEEVRRHDKPEDLWVVLDGNVYDVTNFKDEHPGGDEMLLMVGGMDATETFDAVGHTQEAREKRMAFKIGEVVIEEKPQKVKEDLAKSRDAGYMKVWVVIAIVGYLYYYFH